MQEHMGTKLELSTTFYLQTYGQLEKTNHLHMDILRAYVMDFGCNCDQSLPHLEFDYNKKYHSSIHMAQFEALYERKFTSPVGLFNSYRVWPWGTNFLRDSMDRVKLTQHRLTTTQSRRKSYVDRRVKDVSIAIYERVFLKVSPTKGVMIFGKKGKLNPWFIRPFEILENMGR